MVLNGGNTMFYLLFLRSVCKIAYPELTIVKELYIDKHSEFCLDVEHKYCDTNPERFLFFLGNQFFLVTYHNCMAYDVHDFEMSLIKKVCVKYKILSRWDINNRIKKARNLPGLILKTKT